MQIYELIQELAKYPPDAEVEYYEAFETREPLEINFVAEVDKRVLSDGSTYPVVQLFAGVDCDSAIAR